MTNKIISTIYFIWGLFIGVAAVFATYSMPESIRYLTATGVESAEKYLAGFITVLFLLTYLCVRIGIGLWKNQKKSKVMATIVSISIILLSFISNLLGYVDNMTYILIITFHVMMIVTLNIQKLFRKNERAKSK